MNHCQQTVQSSNSGNIDILATGRYLFIRGQHTLDDQVGTEDSHGADTDTGLSGSIGSTEAGEDDSGGTAQRAEEGLE
jgi:hypothetical protein